MSAAAAPLGVYGDPPWVGRYIGVPFLKRGFDFSGWHCWGMIWRAYRDEAAIELQQYAPLSADDIVAAARTMRRAKALPPWCHIASLEPGESSQALAVRARRALLLRAFDVVEMLTGDAAADGHVGLMIGPRRLIHVEVDCSTVKVDLLDPTIEWRVTGFYRHEALA